jgi:hypothetical protein
VDRRAARGVAERDTEVGVAVDDEVDPMVIDHPPQLGIAEHPPLCHRFGAEGRHGRREVGDDHRQRGVEVAQRRIKSFGFPANLDGHGFERSSVWRDCVLFAPETTAGPGDSGDPDPSPAAQFDDDRITIEEAHAFALERFPEGSTTQAAEIVVSEYGDNRQTNPAEDLGS